MQRRCPTRRFTLITHTLFIYLRLLCSHTSSRFAPIKARRRWSWSCRSSLILGICSPFRLSLHHHCPPLTKPKSTSNHCHTPCQFSWDSTPDPRYPGWNYRCQMMKLCKLGSTGSAIPALRPISGLPRDARFLIPTFKWLARLKGQVIMLALPCYRHFHGATANLGIRPGSMPCSDCISRFLY